MSEVMRLSLDLEFPFQYREDAEGSLCYYADYAALKEQFDFKQNLTEQVVALQKQCDAMAAENAALVAAFTESVTTDATDVFSDTVVINHDWDESGSWSYVDNETEVIRAVLDVIRPVTPATDAYINSVRAEGALLVAERMRKARYVFKDMHHGVVSECADIAVDVAKKLRAGKDGE